MKADAAGLHRIDRIIWRLIAAIAALDLADALLAGFAVAWTSFLVPFGVTAGLLAGQASKAIAER